jgi:hypothetical protein
MWGKRAPRYSQPLVESKWRLTFAWPPGRRRMQRGYFLLPQGDQVAALVGIAPNLRAILAAHIALELEDRRFLGPADRVQRDGLVGVSAVATNLEVAVARVEGVPHRWRGLGRPAISQHAVNPSDIGQPVGVPHRLLNQPPCAKSTRTFPICTIVMDTRTERPRG